MNTLCEAFRPMPTLAALAALISLSPLAGQAEDYRFFIFLAITERISDLS